MRINDISDIIDAIGRDTQRSFVLILRKDCESFLTKLTTEEFSDMMWVGSWSIGDDYLYDVVNTMSEIDVYALMQDNRWRIR